MGDYHLWKWDTTVWDPAEKEKISFRQSTFFDLPISSESIQKRADDYLPRLSEDGELRRFVFSLMDGKTQLGKIADRAMAEFPERFPGLGDAKAAVADLVEKYSD